MVDSDQKGSGEKFFQLCHKTAEAVIFFAVGFE